MTDAIEAKLLSLGYHPIHEIQMASTGFVQGLQSLIGTQLPSEYLDFLLRFPVSGGCSGFVLVHGAATSDFSEDGMYGWDILYAFDAHRRSTLHDIHAEDSDKWPGYLAIGRDLLSNRFFMNIADRFGEIFWSEGVRDLHTDFYRIAESFEQFVERTQFD